MEIGIESLAAPQNCHVFKVCRLCPTVICSKCLQLLNELLSQTQTVIT